MAAIVFQRQQGALLGHRRTKSIKENIDDDKDDINFGEVSTETRLDRR